MKKLFARLAVAFCCATAALRGQSTFTNATLNGVLTINASQIQGSSYIPPAMLGTGIPSSSTVLYGDGAWRANTQQIPSYAGLAGYVLSNTGTSLVWLNSGGLGVSLQQSFTQANSFVAGQPVVILNTGVVAPSVSSTTFSSAVAFGVIQSAGLSSTGFTVVTHGQCVVTGGTFTPGAPYYVPTSATVVTSIAPSSNGFFLTPIAIALNSTTLIVNPQTPSTIGGDITGNSFLATGTFGGSYSAGAVVDYATGNGRISVGSGAAITFYTGGVGTTAMAQLSPTGFTDYGTFTVSGSGAVNLGSGTTTVGNLSVTGTSTLGGLVTYSSSGTFARATGATTGYLVESISNTGGGFYWGVESSTGGSIFAGSPAYAAALGTATNTSLTLWTNNLLALTLDTSQNLIQASGAYHQFGRAYSSGVVTATGTIDVKDSAGNVYHMLVHN